MFEVSQINDEESGEIVTAGFTLDGPEPGNDDAVSAHIDGDTITLRTTSDPELKLRVGDGSIVSETEFNAIRDQIIAAVESMRGNVNPTPEQTSELAAHYVAIERAAYDAIDR